jgi:hypothetical protein
MALAHRATRQLAAGTIWINTYRALAPNMPCRGYNAGGIGWEYGLDAVRNFTHAKSVWVELHPAVDDPSVDDPFSAKLESLRRTDRRRLSSLAEIDTLPG